MVNAAYCIRGTDHQAYFWSGTKFARVRYTPGANDNAILGPVGVRSEWKSLAEEDIGRVDAVCPVPGNKKRLYVFSGANYVKLEIDVKLETSPLKSKIDPSVETSVETGLRPITDGWKTLKRAGWDRIDAAMVVPGSETNIYFFQGKEWIDVSWDDNLVSRGTIAESWPSLVQAEFETVDAILDNYDGTYYVFSGDRYARISMKEDNDTLMAGPFYIKDKWSSLSWV
ncbi:hypothetical protein N7447_004906 [Penicillium robsamsonii]|uniref:uncharacterized protein n=1 Tax=Penicillium robsamsonii TaxID=1792511 RepID=UPI002548F4EA|nr:uncharacterized protein N7447_004906 [Penicillium robsamsonii]KAJ5822566.1 hypothetical protein N7447_004906 [Penicillium robsamsonii]